MTLTPKRKQNQDEGKKKTNLRWLKKKKVKVANRPRTGVADVMKGLDLNF